MLVKKATVKRCITFHSMCSVPTTGLAGLVGGALSMAVGEYISVASQKDSEKVTFAGIACSDAAHFAPCLAAYTEYVAP